MIFPITKININDNSGAILAQCIKILEKSKPKIAGIVADLLVISIKKYTINIKAKKIKPLTKGLNKLKGDKESRIRGLISWTVFKLKRFGNYYINSTNNSILILDRQNAPWATRIYGPVFKEIDKIKTNKAYSLGRHFI